MLVRRLRGHVSQRGGAKLENGAWVTTTMAADLIDEMRGEHDRRVTELLEANNREVERRRTAEREVARLSLPMLLRGAAQDPNCGTTDA